MLAQFAQHLSNEEQETQNWLAIPGEGQLSLDIFRDEGTLVIRTPVAGVSSENVDIAIHGDLLTIRGQRLAQWEPHPDEWFSQECHWGSFSRSIVLPVDVDTQEIQANLRQGVLEIRMPIRGGERPILIRPIEIE